METLNIFDTSELRQKLYILLLVLHVFVKLRGKGVCRLEECYKLTRPASNFYLITHVQLLPPQ